MISDKFYVTVDTTYGPVKGMKRFGVYGDQFIGFQGIPYMKPPVGKLRFRVR
jgi:carboxylesterase type B